MAPFILNGIYKIRNNDFGKEYVADLINGVPRGPICGYKDRSGNTNDSWKITNQGSGGNQITIESYSTPGSFANADQFQGASLLGSHAHTIWTVVKVDAVQPVYYLQSPDAKYVWELPNGADYVNIVLVGHTAKENTKWTFDVVNIPHA